MGFSFLFFYGLALLFIVFHVFSSALYQQFIVFAQKCISVDFSLTGDYSIRLFCCGCVFAFVHPCFGHINIHSSTNFLLVLFFPSSRFLHSVPSRTTDTDLFLHLPEG